MESKRGMNKSNPGINKRKRRFRKRKSRSSAPVPVRRNKIMILPAEIRLQIYNLVLEEDEPYERWINLNGDLPALLRTSNAITRDASPAWYKANHFYISNLPSYGLTRKAIHQIYTAVELAGPNPFLNFHIDVTTPIWENLLELWPFLELIHRTGFTWTPEPPHTWYNFRTQEYFPTQVSPLNVTQGSGRCDKARAALEYMIILAQRARRDGRSLAAMKLEIDAFVERMESPYERTKIKLIA